MGRHALVEGSVEHGHLRNAGQEGVNGYDPFQVGGIVQGCQLHASFHITDHFLGDQHTFLVFFAALDHTVAHG